jgi:hypothetical protein
MKNPLASLLGTSEGVLTLVNTIAMYLLIALGKLPPEVAVGASTLGVMGYAGSRGLAKRG